MRPAPVSFNEARPEGRERAHRLGALGAGATLCFKEARPEGRERDCVMRTRNPRRDASMRPAPKGGKEG